MWSALKAMPLLPKLILGFLVLGVAYKATTSYRSTSQNSFSSESYKDRSESQSESGGEANTTHQASDSEQSARLLAQFQAQHAQLGNQAQQCMAQINRAMQGVAAAAMDGQMVNNMPPCQQQMQLWTAQMAYLETEIYRIQSGDRSSSVRQITGIPEDSGTTSRSTGSSAYSTSDDGIAAVENWDRQANRGTSLYTDESGEQHELPTQNYYFRDRSSGQVVSSDRPYAPNDGRDYEQYTNSNPQQ